MVEETGNKSTVWSRRNKWITGVIASLISFSLLMLVLPQYLEGGPVIYTLYIVIITIMFLVLVVYIAAHLVKGEFDIERKIVKERRANRKPKVDLRESFRDWEPAGGLHPLTQNLDLEEYAGKAYGIAGEAQERKKKTAREIAKERHMAELAIRIREDTREYSIQKAIQKDTEQISEIIHKRKSVDDILSGYLNTIGMRFAPVPRGEFVMGDGKRSRSSPAHNVRFREPMYMSIHPVTQEQWESIMGFNPSRFKDPSMPVINVSHDDCREFIRKLNETERTQEYQLPTEAQWEYACRAGSTGRFCFGDDVHKIRSYAWIGEDPDTGKPHPVGLKDENAWGLFDMHGNVWEWCQDRWHDDYKGAAEHGGAWMTGSSNDRVIRGGSYDTKNCECANRDRRPMDYRSKNIGFRVVMVFDPLALLSQGAFSFVKRS